MKSRNEILHFLSSQKERLKREFHVSKIALFGSFARGEETEQSDIDLLIEMDEETPDLYETKMALREYLSRQLGRPVDIAREKYLKPYAREEIMRDLLYV